MTTFQVAPETVAAMRGNAAGDGTIARVAAEDGSTQSTPAANAGPAATVSNMTLPGNEGEEKGQGGEEKGEISLEILARRVYDELRWRLLVDRERAGFGNGLIGR